MADENLAHLRKMATPTRLGVTIGKDFMGIEYKPFPWVLYAERKILAAIERPGRDFIILNVPPQSGKMQPLETPIPTPAGWTTMGRLCVGDTIFGRNGKPTRITGIFEHTDKPLRRVHFTDGTSVEAGLEHLWHVRDRYREVSRKPRRFWEGTVSTEDMEAQVEFRDGHRRWGVPVAQALQLPEAALPLDPWAVGYWLGNGHVYSTRSNGSHGSVVSTHGDDADYVASRLGLPLEAALLDPRGSNAARIRLNAAFGDGLGRMQGYKHIPDEYLRASEAQRRQLLAGLVDSDGYTGGGSGQCELTFTHEPLALGALELLRTLGEKPRTKISEAAYRLNGVRKVTGTRWRIFWTPRTCPADSPRKVAMWKPKPAGSLKGDRLEWRYVDRIELIPTVPSRCITVDAPDSLYVSGRDFIVSHNSTFGMLLIAWYLGMHPFNQAIFIAYAEEYAATWGLKVRNLLQTYGVEMFGQQVSTQQDSKSNWKMANGFGGMMSVGILGGITGNPGHLIVCLTGDAEVETSLGRRRLDSLDGADYEDLHVLSFNHSTGSSEWRRVLHHQSSVRSDIVEVTTASGRSLRCTSDHPVFVEGLGYTQGGDLRPGDRLRVVLGYDTVSVVRRLRAEPTDVYDLTVEGNPNFFANGILVHNCDDVIKTMEDAASLTSKNKHFDEYDGSISTRFQENTTVLITATRFVEDDLSGRLIERQNEPGYTGDRFEIISIPAIAEPSPDVDLSEEELETWRDELGRKAGEALDGRYSLSFYESRRSSLPPFIWSALYQQNPSARDGGMFPKDNWQWWNEQDGTRPTITRAVRVWDLATTEGGGDWTVGAKWGLGTNGDLYLLEQARFRKGPADVEAEVKAAARADGWAVKIVIEEERAGAGKTVIEHYKRELRGYLVESARAEGTKEQRATPYSIMQNSMRCHLPMSWDKNERAIFVEEHRKMMGDGRRPRHDDQIDTGAYAALDLLENPGVELFIPGQDDLNGLGPAVGTNQLMDVLTGSNPFFG